MPIIQPDPPKPPPSSTPNLLPGRYSVLPRFYTYRDVLTILFDEDVDAFLDAYCDGSMPVPVQRNVEDTMSPTSLHSWLTRRVVRQLNALLAEVRKP